MSDMVPIRPETTSLDQKPRQKRDDRPEMEPVVKHPGRLAKPSLAKKAASTFLAEDIENVKSFIIFDVIVPGIKEAFLSSMEMLLFGSTRRGGRRNVGRTNERVSYDTYYDSSRNGRSDRGRSTSNGGKSSINDIELDYPDEADDAVEAIQERIIRYGDASLQDLFRACRMSYDHVDQNWGWERGQENDFYTQRLRNGKYTIITPKLRLLQ